jgi:hypothetical protein
MGGAMGQQSITQRPDRGELSPRGSITIERVDVVHRVGICRAWGVPSREDWKSAAVSNDVALEER